MNIKLHKAFHKLEKVSKDIRLEVDTFMKNIVEWVNEMKELAEEEESSATFLLPKTPKQKRTSRRKERKVLASKGSEINSTFQTNESINLDGSISNRTRSARRAVTSKLSELNVTKDTKAEESKQEVTEKSLIGNASDATFIKPNPSTRTKPVLKVKQPQEIVPEPNKNEVSTTATESSRSSAAEKNSVSRTERESLSRHTVSKSPEESSEQRLSKEKTPVIIKETPVKRVSKRRTLSVSPARHSNTRKISRTLSGSPAVRRTGSASSRNSRKNSAERLKTSRSVGESPLTGCDGSQMSQKQKASTPECRNSLNDKTITIKNEFTPKATSTFVVFKETCLDSAGEDEKTPVVNEKTFSKLNKTSTPGMDLERTPVVKLQRIPFEENRDEEPVSEMDKEVSECTTDVDPSVNETEDTVDNSDVRKKKRKVKKHEEEVKENIEEPQETMRITRTKSKALKQMLEQNESKQAELTNFAEKVLNKAKITSMKKTQLAALLECNSSTPGLVRPGLPFGNLTASKSKYHLLLSGTKKLKTPGSVISKSAVKNLQKPKVANGDALVEQLIRTATKPQKDDNEIEIKLKSRNKKEEDAILKRQNVMKNKQEELKRKNELKHQMAMKQREKLEQEKYKNMIQSEKEKEERHRLILQERQAKVKEEAQKRKMLTQQKIAETVERRRIEEEARIAKLKEMEAEEQRLALERQKEQERQEKRAQERLAQKKAREEYEMQMKQELEAERLKAEKLLTAKKCVPSTSKLQSATKRQRFGVLAEKPEWDYKPRSEDDYGLEDEHSEIDSEDEKTTSKNKPVMAWAKNVMKGKNAPIKINLEILSEFLPCYQKSPDIHKMFKMTPSKRIKRTSSAIWNTPSS